jgi:hypothetical protein
MSSNSSPSWAPASTGMANRQRLVLETNNNGNEVEEVTADQQP